MSTRYFRGDTRPVEVPVATAAECEVGDIVGLASDTLIRAEDQAWDTNLATTQTAFALLFLGVAAQRKVDDVARVPGNGEDNIIRVDSDGIFEFDCASASFAFGDYVGPAKQSGDLLESQKVVEVASEALAIGRVVESATSVTRVKVKLLSKLANASRFA
jgi:hypothetical protein